MQNDILIIHSDGGARGNPGPAACGFVSEHKGKVIEKQSKFLGIQTNNVAEYQGVILALSWLVNFKDKSLPDNVLYYLDSELVVKQLNGLYKIKMPRLQELSFNIKKLISQTGKSIIFRHTRRENNSYADLLVNQELDRH